MMLKLRPTQHGWNQSLKDFSEVRHSTEWHEMEIRLLQDQTGQNKAYRNVALGV